ncbi:polysaccharide deacetylase family protein [Haloferacaceae archaeon DSL9]
MIPATGRGGGFHSRRTVLKATGAGAVGVAGSPLLSGTVRARAHDGMVVFTYDDSPVEDYTKTYAVHGEYGVPGCVAACPGLMATGASRYLSPEQLLEMHGEGWDVLSHTLEHRCVGEIPLTRDVAAGDTRVYVRSDLHGQFEGDPLTIFTGDARTTATVVDGGVAGGDPYLVLEDGVDRPFAATDEPRVRYTEPFLRHIFEESRAQLESWGATVTGFVYPYGRYDGLAETLVPEYYGAVPNSRTGRGGFNPHADINPLGLVRTYIEEDAMSEERLAEFMNGVATRSALGIVGGHSQYSTLTESRLRLAIELAQESNLKIVTLREALDELGVLSAPSRPPTAEPPASEPSTPNPIRGRRPALRPQPTGSPSPSPQPASGSSEGSPGLFSRFRAFLRSLFSSLRSALRF